ncbi:MAG: hypothetical protein QM770_01090 [Tepidisphaeraceae bacterium]
MPFQSTGLRVLIASPSDLKEERDTVERAIHDWNRLHAEAEGVTLHPVRWETDAMPETGVRPQGAIDEQLVDPCDLLIGLFWTKLGTSTGVAESGTVEEIDRVVAAGKPAMLYFSDRPAEPSSINVEQLGRLRDFKQRTYQIALVGKFSSLDELWRTLAADLTKRVRAMKKALFVNAASQPKQGTDDGDATTAITEIDKFFQYVRSAGYKRGPQSPNVAVALHPVQSITPRLDVDEIDQRAEGKGRINLRPMRTSGWNTHLFGNSIVVDNGRGRFHDNERTPATSIAELRDDGVIQAVTSVNVDTRFDSKRICAFEAIERMVLAYMAKSVAIQRELGAVGTIMAAIQVTGVKGAELRPSAANMYDVGDFRPNESGVVKLGPIHLPEGGDVAKMFFKEFTRVWRDAGIRYDPCFDRDGKWIAVRD